MQKEIQTDFDKDILISKGQKCLIVIAFWSLHVDLRLLLHRVSLTVFC